jgi:hypothetical protein
LINLPNNSIIIELNAKLQNLGLKKSKFPNDNENLKIIVIEQGRKEFNQDEQIISR